MSLPERILLVPEKLVFDCRSGGRLVLTPSVLMVMQGYRQIGSEDLEAGGVLMGRIENNGCDRSASPRTPEEAPLEGAASPERTACDPV